jgi:hypothetical protein
MGNPAGERGGIHPAIQLARQSGATAPVEPAQQIADSLRWDDMPLATAAKLIPLVT